MGGIWRGVHIYAKANNKYMENYDPSIGPSYFMYWDINNPYGWAMSQKSQQMNFNRLRRNLNSHKKNIHNYDIDSEKGYILEADVCYPKCLEKYIMILYFYLKD